MNPLEPTHPIWLPIAFALIIGLIFGVTRVWGWAYDKSLQWFTRRNRR